MAVVVAVVLSFYKLFTVTDNIIATDSHMWKHQMNLHLETEGFKAKSPSS